MIELDEVIAEVKRLEPLPQSAPHLGRVLAQADWSYADVVGVVERDPVLAGNVLALANSALSGSRCQVRELREAVLRIGAGDVLMLALETATRRHLAASNPAYGMLGGELWRHSMAAALVMRNLGGLVEISLPAGAHACALLHDIGKAVLGRHLTGARADLLQEAMLHSTGSVAEVEMELIETHHGEVGALMARHWNLPEPIPSCIQHHHDGGEARSGIPQELQDALRVADDIASLIGEDDLELRAPSFSTPAMYRLGLDVERATTLAARVREDFESLGLERLA